MMLKQLKNQEEIASRGRAIYESQLRENLQSAHKGKFVIIDVNSEDYEMAEDDLTATKKILARRPDAVLFGIRIGYPTAYTLGGHGL